MAFDGLCASQGFDPLHLPWDRFLNLAYYFLIRDADQEGIDKLERVLWMPPTPDVEVEYGPWSAAAETAALGAFGMQFEALGGDADA